MQLAEVAVRLQGGPVVSGEQAWAPKSGSWGTASAAVVATQQYQVALTSAPHEPEPGPRRPEPSTHTVAVAHANILRWHHLAADYHARMRDPN